MRRLIGKDRPCPTLRRRAGKTGKAAGRRGRAPKRSRSRLGGLEAWMTRDIAVKGAAGLAGLLVLASVIGLIGSGWAGRTAVSLAPPWSAPTISS